MKINILNEENLLACLPFCVKIVEYGGEFLMRDNLEMKCSFIALMMLHASLSRTAKSFLVSKQTQRRRR